MTHGAVISPRLFRPQSRNRAVKKIFDRCIYFVTCNPRRSARQVELIKKMFKSKYGISPRKVQVEVKPLMLRFGVEHLGYVIGPTLAQLDRGRRTHVNYKDFYASPEANDDEV